MYKKASKHKLTCCQFTSINKIALFATQNFDKIKEDD